MGKIDETKASAPSTGGFSSGGSTSEQKDEAKDPAPSAGGFSFAASTPAPATGGFSFAGSSPDENDEVKAPAPSTGGFSFGGSAPSAALEKKDEAKAPSTGGFSFGGSTAAASAQAAGGFSFGGSAPERKDEAAKTSTPASAAADQATAAGTYPSPPPPIEYQTKTVQEIINTFTECLEKDAVEFAKQAQRVAEWDAVLRESQSGMEELTEQVRKLLFQRQEVDRTLNGVCAYQKELSSTLDGLEVSLFYISVIPLLRVETLSTLFSMFQSTSFFKFIQTLPQKQIDQLFQAQSNLRPQDADREREVAYQRAIDVDARLTALQHSLYTLVGDLNAAAERATASVNIAGSSSGVDGKENVGQIVQLLNLHHETLVWLENTCRSLEGDLSVIGRALHER